MELESDKIRHLGATLFRGAGDLAAICGLAPIAIVSLLFAIHGAYIQRMYGQFKQRPLALIETSIVPGEGNESTEEAEKVQVLWIGEEERTDIGER